MDQLPWYVQFALFLVTLIGGLLYMERGTKRTVAAMADVPNQVKEQNKDLANQLGQSVLGSLALLQRSDAKIDALETTVQSLQTKLADRERVSAENKRQIEELVNDSQASAQERKDFKEQIQALNALIGTQQKDLTEVQRTLKEAQDELAATKAELANTKTELEKATQRIADLEAERTTTAAEKEQLTKDLEAERAKVSALEKTVAEQQQQINKLQSEVDRLTAELAAKEKPSGGPEGSQP